MKKASLSLILVLFSQILFPQIALACWDIAVSPTSLDFGDIQVGSSSTAQTVTITNSNGGKLVIGTITITDTDASQFAIVSDNASGQTLSKGVSANVTVIFRPTSAGNKMGSLFIPSNDPDENPFIVTLSGTGTEGPPPPPTGPDISVSPSSINFGQVQVGTASASENITVTNEGDDTLLIYNLSINDTGFTITSGNISGQSLLPGDSANITLAFAPATPGVQSANLTIPSNDADEATVNVLLSGTGAVSPQPSPPEGFYRPQMVMRYFTVDFLGKITQEVATSDGRPIRSMQAPSPDGIHLLEIEEYTGVTDNTGGVVTLLVIREAEAMELPENTVLVGKALEFKPTGTFFDKPVKLTLGYNVNDLPDRVQSIGAAYYADNEGWIYLEAEATNVAELGKLTAPVYHFTIFAVLAKVAPEPPPAKPVAPPAPKPEPEPEKPALSPIPEPALFKLSNLSITLSVTTYYEHIRYIVRTGEEALITMGVTNTGGQSGSYVAILMVNGTKRERKEVTLGPGQTKTVSFTITSNEPGKYTVVIGDLTGDFLSELWVNWWLIAGSCGILILIALGAWYLVKRKSKA